MQKDTPGPLQESRGTGRLPCSIWLIRCMCLNIPASPLGETRNINKERNKSWMMESGGRSFANWKGVPRWREGGDREGGRAEMCSEPGPAPREDREHHALQNVGEGQRRENSLPPRCRAEKELQAGQRRSFRPGRAAALGPGALGRTRRPCCEASTSSTGPTPGSCL